LYAYAKQNPLRLIDLNGKEPTKNVPSEVQSFVNGIADYFSNSVEIATDSLSGRPGPTWITRMRTGGLAGDLMREDLASILGQNKFEVRYSSSSVGSIIDLSMKDIPVDIEFKLTRGAKRSVQSFVFEKYAKQNKRLLVYVYGNSLPEYFDYTTKSFTSKQLDVLESAVSRIQEKLSVISRGAAGGGEVPVRNETEPGVEVAEPRLTQAKLVKGVMWAGMAWNIASARTPGEVVNRAASTATNVMGSQMGEEMGMPFGPIGIATGAAAGSVVSDVVKDPVGFGQSTVDCVFGGYCGLPSPEDAWHAAKGAWHATTNATEDAVDYVFGIHWLDWLN